eukprot:CAMPEP_0175084116 /NCGR_PEP_ID=MMETSP0052_2-20121109/27843_1 /TAXON_ID=51329 ORGANISM="Polytomella parva, Strain SAG 63-3" /NCGR_SAMPLE_ID=MMETSP0052_2 /ASSEMBLY_ACC=CAM_ASM_000194 /LENGTH=140 /DNA_ID=CAMNT_0016355809 /DNA_START=217 /DNA_END=640 /DNA_ORIENTATION=-
MSEIVISVIIVVFKTIIHNSSSLTKLTAVALEATAATEDVVERAAGIESLLFLALIILLLDGKGSLGDGAEVALEKNGFEGGGLLLLEPKPRREAVGNSSSSSESPYGSLRVTIGGGLFVFLALFPAANETDFLEALGKS